MGYITTYTLRGSNNLPPTALSLAEELGWEVGTDIPTDTPVVNWGRRFTYPANENILNDNASIDKDRAFELFRERGIPTPNFITGPYITRSNMHIGGSDIREYRGSRRFVVERIEKEREYRIEVFLPVDLEFLAFRGHIKYPTHPPNQQPFNWNRDNTEWETFGYRGLRAGNIPSSVQELGIRAVRALDYDFGAVDIIEDRDSNYYVLEVNSAPGLLGDSDPEDPTVGIRKYAYRIERWSEGR